MPKILFNKETAGEAGKKGGKISKRPPSIMKALNKMLLDPENKSVTVETLALSLYRNYIKGNPTAIKELLGRSDGVLKERLEIEESLHNDELKGMSDKQLKDIAAIMRRGKKKK